MQPKYKAVTVLKTLNKVENVGLLCHICLKST